MNKHLFIKNNSSYKCKYCLCDRYHMIEHNGIKWMITSDREEITCLSDNEKLIKDIIE